MKIFLALVVLAGYVQMYECTGVPEPAGGGPPPGEGEGEGAQPGGPIKWTTQEWNLPTSSWGVQRGGQGGVRVGILGGIIGGGAGGRGQGNLQLSNDDIELIIKQAQARGEVKVVAVLRKCQAQGRTRVSDIMMELSMAKVTLSADLLQWIKLRLGIDLRVGVGLGINTKKIGQQAVNSVKKILKLAQGILVSVLKQLADFLKTYLPQIASTTVTFCNALLPPYVDALVGCTAPIIQLIGLLIAECPKDPTVENSTSSGNTTAPGAPGGPGGIPSPPWTAPGGPPPVIGSGAPPEQPADPPAGGAPA